MMANETLFNGVVANFEKVFARGDIPGVFTCYEPRITSVEEFHIAIADGDQDLLKAITVFVNKDLQKILKDLFVADGQKTLEMVKYVSEPAFLNSYPGGVAMYASLLLAYAHLTGETEGGDEILWFNKVLVRQTCVHSYTHIDKCSNGLPAAWNRRVRIGDGCVHFVSRRRSVFMCLCLAVYVAAWIGVAVLKVRASDDKGWGEYFFSIHESMSYGLMYAGIVGLGAFGSIRDLSRWLRGWEIIPDVDTLVAKLDIEKETFLVGASHMSDAGAVFSRNCGAVRRQGSGGLSGRSFFKFKNSRKYGYIFFEGGRCFDFFQNRLLKWTLLGRGMYRLDGTSCDSVLGGAAVEDPSTIGDDACIV